LPFFPVAQAQEVLGELTMPALEKPMTIHVVRVGVFEPAQ